MCFCMNKIFSALLIILTVANLSAQSNELFLDNGTLVVKIDLTRGGAINYISLSGSNRSLVNIHDEGRYIQQSYYSGQPVDRTVQGQNPHWSPWRWNPVQAGDSYWNRSATINYYKNGDTLYSKCIPLLWDMNNQQAEAEMEQWTMLKGNVIEVKNRLTCHRTDTIYNENVSTGQELPAVYPISALSKLYAYLGYSPFTNDTISNPSVAILSNGSSGSYSTVSEHWMAFVDNNNWGLGVYSPDCTTFTAGIFGGAGGESKDNSTAYIGPLKADILNKNTVYEYGYFLIVGTVNEIRHFVYQVGHANTTTEWNFSNSTLGWNLAHSLANTSANDTFSLNITGPDPYLISPDFLGINASMFKYVAITMKNKTNDTQAGFYWTTNQQTNFSQNLFTGFLINANDPKFTTYILDLSNNSNWTGIIKQIRLDPTQNASSGSVELSQIKFLSSLSSVYSENTNSLLTNYELWQNYPNPFNPSTTIIFSIPPVGRNGISTYKVVLKVYDVLGREVATLVNEEKAPGEYSVEFRAQSLPSGVYFYKLQAGDYTETKKMVLVK